MKFYQIEQPTTKQIFDAIINNEYVPLEKVQSKAKQIKVLLKDYFCSDDIYITFNNVTNCGGVPIFLGGNFCFHEIAQETMSDYYNSSEEEVEQEIELLSFYLRTYDKIFNLN